MFVFAFPKRSMDGNRSEWISRPGTILCMLSFWVSGGLWPCTSFIIASMSSKSLIFTPLAILDTPSSGVW